MKTIDIMLITLLLFLSQIYAQGTFKLSANKNNYSYGELIEVKATVANNTDSSFSLWGSSTCMMSIAFNSVQFELRCTADYKEFPFPPGSSRTWTWNLDPLLLGIPDKEGNHIIRGFSPGKSDSITITAPKYYGGRIWVYIRPHVKALEIQRLRDSLNADVLSSYIFNDSTISEYWQINNHSIDSAVSYYSKDYRLYAISAYRLLLVAKQIDNIPFPNAPNLVLPANNSVNQPFGPTLKWRRLKDADKYHLQLSTAKDFSSFVINDTSIIDTTKLLANLNQNTQYYWRFRGVNQVGKSSWSEIWSFTTTAPIPAVPLLSQPANNTKDYALNLIFKWKINQFTEKYVFLLAEDEYFSKAIANDTTLTDTLKEIKGLKEGQKYYWKVESINIAGKGPFSDIWNFTTMLNAPDSLKTKALSKTKIQLSWNDNSSGETGFIIERKQESDFITLDTLKANIVSYIDSTAQQFIQYQYRIKSYTLQAVSQYSNVAFATITGVEESDGIPKEYVLEQNFPNPFNPATTIKYSIPKETYVNLKIFDMLGSEISILVNKEQGPGDYKVQFDGSSLPSGVYIYTLQAGSYRDSKKLILLK